MYTMRYWILAAAAVIIVGQLLVLAYGDLGPTGRVGSILSILAVILSAIAIWLSHQKEAE
jgi:hypothetical protein